MNHDWRVLRVTEQAILEGWISVLASLQANNRDIYQLYLQRDKWNAQAALVERQARGRAVPVHRVDPTVIARYATGQSHGGIVALAGPRRYQPLDSLGRDATAPFVAMLDGIEDPFNFGQAVRALYAAGAHGLVVRPRTWISAAGIVARASAGASELMPVAVAPSPIEAADHFKARGLAIVCTAALENRMQGNTVQNNILPLYEADLTRPLFLVIGGEKRGVARPLLDKADLWLHIPYQATFEHSLGAAASAAIIAFEVLRQRLAKRETTKM
jgi:23S rRNA (guanosine2251-2'-O)-methyltransferase